MLLGCLFIRLMGSGVIEVVYVDSAMLLVQFVVVEGGEVSREWIFRG